MLTTTLNRIREHSPCHHGWIKLLNGLGKLQADDEPLPYATIAEINSIYDAIWCCRAEPQHSKIWRLFAVWCARRIQHHLKDERTLNAIDTAERHANGLATDVELSDAHDAAATADDDADAAWYTASASAHTAAWYTAWHTTWYTASASADQKAKFIEMVSEEI